MSARQGYAPTRGTSLYYEVTGQGPPVVFLHGFSFDHRMWEDQVVALSGQFMVVTYDLRGFGRSVPGTESYTHADDLAALLEHLGLSRVTLLGLSLGGGAALNFALLRPERVRALVLVDPSLGGFPWSAEFAAFQAAVRTAVQLGGVTAARACWLSLPLFRPAMAKPVVAARLRAMVEDYSGWHWVNPDLGRPLSPPAYERLEEIGAPTLVTVGEEDTADFRRIAELLARRVRGAREVVLRSVGHMANLEDPVQFNAVLLGFLGTLQAGEKGTPVPPA